MQTLQSRAGLTSALLGLVLAVAPSAAAITFDAASRAATTSTGRTSLSWSHTIGGGTDRVLVVGVAVEDASTTDANITAVTFNGIALTPVPNSKRSGGGTGIIQTQLFYLLSASLGAAGSRTITVTMQGAVDGISAGAVSLTGVSQAAPQSVTTNVDTSGADSISTSITSPAANSWVVDVVGSGNSGSFTANSGQTERVDIAASGMTGAMSTKALTSAGATTLGWAHNGANRLAHSLASLAPSGGTTPNTFTLTTNVSGSGSVSRNPNAASYAAGTVVTLTATPAAGFQFSGWSGDLSGSANPTTITMSANRTVTATFTTTGGQGPFTLSVSVTGSGSVTRSPNQATYPAGTVVTLTRDRGRRLPLRELERRPRGHREPGHHHDERATGAWWRTSRRSRGASTSPSMGSRPRAGAPPAAANLAPINVSSLDQLRTLAGQDGSGRHPRGGDDHGQRGDSCGFQQVHRRRARGAAGRHRLQHRPEQRVRPDQQRDHPEPHHGEAAGPHRQGPGPVRRAPRVDRPQRVLRATSNNGVDFYDGQIDITHGADFITVSWNIFHDHFKNSLVGNSENTGDEDSGHLRVTYHHNLFTRVDGRNPSIRFGTGHVYNNHYLNIPDYGIASRQNAQVRVENNYFDNVDQPIRADTSLSDVAGLRQPGEHEHLRELRTEQHHDARVELRAAVHLSPGRGEQRTRHRAAGSGRGEGDLLIASVPEV